MIESMKEEWQAMISGHFVPFHILCVLVGTVVSIFFSTILCNNTIYDGRIAVIDLDHSQSSTSLIEKLDASNVIEVSYVIHSPMNPKRLMAHDRNLGALYIPKGFEENLISGRQNQNIGYFADSTNSAQNAHILKALQPIIASATDGAAVKTGAVQLVTRQTFNASTSNTNIMLVGFLCFFSALYLGITSLMIIGRLHVTKLWQETILDRTPLALIARLFPYAFIYTASIIFFMGLLSFFNDLRFAGNVLLFIPSVFATALAIGLIAMLFTWNHKTPANGAAFMIFIVPPGFIMGGTTFAVAMLPDWTYYFSYLFPLTWIFRVFRDVALRAESFHSMSSTLGCHLIYVTILALLITVRFYRTRQKMIQESQEI